MYFSLQKVAIRYYTYSLLKCIDIQTTLKQYYFQFFSNSIMNIQVVSKSSAQPIQLYSVYWSYFFPLEKTFTTLSRNQDNLLEIIHNTDSSRLYTLMYAGDFVEKYSPKTIGKELASTVDQAKRLSKRLTFITQADYNGNDITDLFKLVLHSFFMSKIMVCDVINYIRLKKPNMGKADSIVTMDFDFEETIFKANEDFTFNNDYNMVE